MTDNDTLDKLSQDDEMVTRLRNDARALRHWARDQTVLGEDADSEDLCAEAEKVDDTATKIELWSIFDRKPPE